jgi:hypothetical protein
MGFGKCRIELDLLGIFVWYLDVKEKWIVYGYIEMYQNMYFKTNWVCWLIPVILATLEL